MEYFLCEKGLSENWEKTPFISNIVNGNIFGIKQLSNAQFFYNAMILNNCFIKGSHEYDVYSFEGNKAHVN